MGKSSSRLISLDIFRGMTIAFMILVNTPGSWKYVYAPLKHAEWHGCTPNFARDFSALRINGSLLFAVIRMLLLWSVALSFTEGRL